MGEWVFFVDRDLGKSIPNALRAEGYRVERHDDHFDSRTPDEIWLPEVASRMGRTIPQYEHSARDSGA
ncbi:MAG: hypothetical protein ACR2OG_01520 [Gemmatimonadaceae bacterium]